MIRRALVAGLLAGVLAGCGGSGSLSPFEQSALLDPLDEARAAAAAGDLDAARASLGELRERVLLLRRRGDLGADSAERLLAEIGGAVEVTRPAPVSTPVLELDERDERDRKRGKDDD